MGYWLAKGVFNPSFPFSVIFKTNKKLHAEKLGFVLDNLGLGCNPERKTHSLYISYKFELTDQSKRIKMWADTLGFDYPQTNPQTLAIDPMQALNLTQAELLGVWEGWTTAEGYRNNTTQYAETLNKSVADFMQLVALRLGYRCYIKTFRPSNKQTSFYGSHKKIVSDLYRLKVSDKHPIIRVTSKNWEKRKYKGKVYCITTSTGFFLGRTNGKVGVLGQCDALRYLSSNLFGLGGKTVISEQKIGPPPNPQMQTQYTPDNWMSKKIGELTEDNTAGPTTDTLVKGKMKILF